MPHSEQAFLRAHFPQFRDAERGAASDGQVPVGRELDFSDCILMPSQYRIELALMVPYLRDIAPSNEYFMWLCADDSEHGPIRNASVVNRGCVCEDVGTIHQCHPSLVQL